MLHTAAIGTATETKRTNAVLLGPNEVRRGSKRTALADPSSFAGRLPSAHAQSIYGNQAMLRMLSRSSGVGDRSIQRKAGCGCGGSTSQGKGNQFADRFHERGVDEEETNEISDQGIVLMQEDTKPVPPGSGTCINGGGESGCFLKDGVYKIVRIQNTCCTKDCTIKHEKTHISDQTGWGCCKAASIAYNKKDADQADVEAKFKKWNDGVRTTSECNAHKTSVACADQMKKDKKCDDDGKDSACCKDLDQYRETYAARMDIFCNAKPKDLPPCPF
jgi:hypothetical protein